METEQIEIKENENKKPKKKRKIVIDILIYAVIIAAILLLVLPKYFELKINIEVKEDIAFAKELNANLTESGSIETIDDLKEVLKKYGYVFEDIEASIDNCYFVWESETNQIMFVEKRDDKRPMMSDLRSSGSIEQDADIILFIYREDYYKHNDATDESDNNSIVELQIAKHRQGARGKIKLLFMKNIGTFSDFADGGFESE